MPNPQVARFSRAANLTRRQLASVAVTPRSACQSIFSHHEVIDALVDVLHFLNIAPMREATAVSKDGMEMFGVVELEATFQGCRFAIGIRNTHNNVSMRLAMTAGYRVLASGNNPFAGDFTPGLAKHSKNFTLIHSREIGVSDMQRNCVPMTEQVNRWRDSQLSDVTARLVIYQAFIEAELRHPEASRAVPVHKLYFNPEHEEFAPRTMWSLSNAFTSALKQLDPIPQYRATAKLAPFLETRLVR